MKSKITHISLWPNYAEWDFDIVFVQIYKSL